MKMKDIMFTVLSVMFVMSLASFPTAADDSEIVDLTEMQCRELLLSSGADRETTMAFLQGYFSGKSGSTKLDVDKMFDASEALLLSCVDDPKRNILKELEKILSKS